MWQLTSRAIASPPPPFKCATHCTPRVQPLSQSTPNSKPERAQGVVNKCFYAAPQALACPLLSRPTKPTHHTPPWEPRPTQHRGPMRRRHRAIRPHKRINTTFPGVISRSLIKSMPLLPKEQQRRDGDTQPEHPEPHEARTDNPRQRQRGPKGEEVPWVSAGLIGLTKDHPKGACEHRRDQYRRLSAYRIQPLRRRMAGGGHEAARDECQPPEAMGISPVEREEDDRPDQDHRDAQAHEVHPQRTAPHLGCRLRRGQRDAPLKRTSVDPPLGFERAEALDTTHPLKRITHRWLLNASGCSWLLNELGCSQGFTTHSALRCSSERLTAR
jgi:hypothetical protein